MKLHDEQELAVGELYESDATALIADMGVGKTVIALTAISELLADGVIKFAIIWAPKRVAQNVWAQEAKQWAHLTHLKITVLAGTPKQRSVAMASRSNIIVLNYELADWAKEQGLRATDRTAVIYDEVTRLKNPSGRRRKSVMAIGKDALMRWGLTGSPKSNGPLDLWGVADAIVPGCWKGFYAWRSRFFRPVDPDRHMWKVLPGVEEIIDEEFTALSFKVISDVNPTPVMLEDHVTLPDKAFKQYRELEEEMMFELEEGLDITTETSAGVTMKVRQMASGSVIDDRGERHWIHDAKLDALRDIVNDSGEPVLVLYQFRAEVAAMRRIWPELAVLGGETDDKLANKHISNWNAGKIRVLAGHPASMGHGLNLQHGGRRAVWFSLPWSLEEYVQANARLARQGQEQQVYIHHLLADQTIDRRVLRALQDKRSVQHALLDLLMELS